MDQNRPAAQKKAVAKKIPKEAVSKKEEIDSAAMKEERKRQEANKYLAEQRKRDAQWRPILRLV
jgi:hypothetical protein